MLELTHITDWFVPFLVPLFAAFVSGAIVGLERLRRNSPIGVKTCSLVCAGATAYMSVGHLILQVADQPGDPTRIASQIITGIGFLGAGAILHGSIGVSGLSSAATVWILGAIGIVIGCDLPITGILLSIVVVALLTIVGTLETWVKGRGQVG